MQFTKRASAVNLISLLREQGYSFADIASKIGVSELTIRRWGQGKGKPHQIFVREMEKLKKDG